METHRKKTVVPAGAGIRVLVIGMAVTVIVRTSREIHRYKKEMEERV